MEPEEGPESKQPGLPAGVLDPVAQKKHAAMLDRLANLHQSRLEQSAARSAAAAASPAFESVSAFLDRFAESRRSVEAELQRCRALAADLASAPRLKPELEKVATSIADLDRLVAENSYFLPSYEVRSSLKAISVLKEALETASAELLPRKKFSFRNKTSKKDPGFLVKQIEETSKAATEKPDLPAVRDSPGFRNKEGSVFIKQFTVSEEGEGDFTLSDLNACEIYLKGRLRSLFIHRLTNCKVFAGPVLGSVLIEEVKDCLFVLASHQIRIHHARATDFYLRLRSRPIIEDCNGVRFAPYRLSYEGLEEELRDCGLGEETGNWAHVDDFKWLRAVQSPNWNVIPEEELMDTINASDIKEQIL
ncbi:tubulin-folding cofactor C [Canna indica]|uniref:Tubulin-folding cofactor C n=1 Tax=Canna indica TaxID=4628 RepID=A0AAQ3JN66_9LILI|nr:tubulin-folding cofactor C [Canna indica]